MMTTKENTMTDFNTVLSFVTLDATQDQLENIMEAMKFRREKLSKLAKYSFKAGMPVVFTHKGVTYNGTLKSVKVKKAVVECIMPNTRAYNSRMQPVPATVLYNVPLNMLKAA